MSKRKGQNIAEYVILVALIIAAAAAMQVYLRRGLQGRMADAVDYAPTLNVIGTSDLSFNTKQYEPYYSNQASTVSSNSGYIDTLNQRGGMARNDMQQRTSRGAGSWEASEWESFNAR